MACSNLSNGSTQPVTSNINLSHVKRANSMCNSSYSSYINDINGLCHNHTNDTVALIENTQQTNSVLDKKISKDKEDYNSNTKVCSIINMDEKGKTIDETRSTNDWYASVSDMEDESSIEIAKPYGCNAVNPVLECVNQVIVPL